MIALEYQIFTPSKARSTISENLIVYSLWIFSICLFIIADKIQPLEDFIAPFKTVYLVIATLLSIFFSISPIFRHERLSGKITGILKINLDFITINDISYPINELLKIDFHFGDYFGQLNKSGNGNFNPLLSEGVSNSLEFTDCSNKRHQIHFKLNYKWEHKRLFPFITEMIKINKISFLRGIEILGINDYNKIQEFKKSLIAI